VSKSWRADKRKTSERGYGHRWQVARADFLKRNPLCIYCEREGRIKLADVVDHRIPHQGDPGLFWDVDNWQPICSHHHNTVKAAEEGRAKPKGGDASGMPTSPLHHWNQKR
jgi:5-methylcytosine-specific restriction enzyme A